MIKELFAIALRNDIDEMRKAIYELAFNEESGALESCVENKKTPEREQVYPRKNNEDKNIVISEQFNEFLAQMRKEVKNELKPLVAFSENGMMIFPNRSVAAKHLGINAHDITCCCEGLQQSAKGMKFAYVFHNKKGELL